jgi:hypothetical protein
LEKTNEKYKSDYYEFFTLVVKGQYVKEIIDMLKKIGFKSKYPGSMTLVVRVKAGHVGCFPVRNLQQEIIETSNIIKGSRVLFGCYCSLYESSEGEKKVQFNLQYVRLLEKYLGEEDIYEEKVLGKDTGPTF